MDENSKPGLVFALHCHQPTGNVREVFERAHDSCYRPVLDLIETFEDIRLCLHLSGPLLEWIEAHRPETISLVASLVARGQVEILGGGWQEPILPVIPTRDALGQLRTMRWECARLFGAMPSGMWLPERVWEPELAALGRDGGYSWTLVDDTHLAAAGVTDEHPTGWWITEKHGKSLAVFPISRALRYAIPYARPSAIVDIVGEAPARTWTYGDDGEKFGLWPGTAKHVWEEGWLRRFFETLVRASREGRLETVLPSAVLATEPPAGRVYMPTSSYMEMGEWSLPPAASRRLRDLREKLEDGGLDDLAAPFVHGGTWPGFLARYPESNWLHKHVLRVSEKIARAERRDRARMGGLSSSTEEARRDLYRSQTNCAYWHGLFGGLYLPHLRRALWKHAVLAENVVDALEPSPRLTTGDLDCDGREEVLVESSESIVVVAPGLGGCVTELIHRPSCMNVVDTLARRRELYHDETGPRNRPDPPPDDGEVASIHEIDRSMDDEMRAKLVHDDLPRRAFQDAVLTSMPDHEAMERGAGERLIDLDSRAWTLTECVQDADRVVIRLRIGATIDAGSLEVRKTLVVPTDEARVNVRWDLAWHGEEPLEAVFSSRCNVNLLAGHSRDRFYRVLDPDLDLDDRERMLDSRGCWEELAGMSLVDVAEGIAVGIEVSPPCRMIRHPVETVSQAEGGFQLTYQGSCLAACWPVKLENWVEWTARASIAVGEPGR